MKILAIIFPLLSLFFSCGSDATMNSKNDLVVNYYSAGEITVLKSSDDIDTIEELILTLFESSDDLLLLDVTDAAINDLKKNDDCIELIYPSDQTFEISGKQQITASRLLIPLSGKYASEDQLTFFYGSKKWVSGPLVRFSGREKIVTALNQVLNSQK